VLLVAEAGAACGDSPGFQVFQPPVSSTGVISPILGDKSIGSDIRGIVR
jgi:hypothetical protein